MWTEVFIKGNYGFGNLGDDILLITTVKAVMGYVPPGSILVEVDKPDIVSKWLPEVKFIEYGTIPDVHAEHAIYGGGGQFFSFPQKNKGISRQIRRLFRLISGDISKEEWLRFFLKGKERKRANVHSQSIMAFCVGVGPFVKNSSEIQATKEALSNCSIVTVRDKQSKECCEPMGIKNVEVFTDIAFLSKSWHDSNSNKENARLNSHCIGIVFRSWPYGNYGENYFACLRRTANKIRAHGFNVKFISFSQSSDERLIHKLKGEEICIWDPAASSPGKFIKETFADCQMVVSARAHGIILPAILGIPGICIDIEPKLQGIHEMLTGGTKLWSFPFNENELFSYVKEIAQDLSKYKQLIRDDVKKNYILAQSAVSKLQEFFKLNT